MLQSVHMRCLQVFRRPTPCYVVLLSARRDIAEVKTAVPQCVTIWNMLSADVVMQICSLEMLGRLQWGWC